MSDGLDCLKQPVLFKAVADAGLKLIDPDMVIDFDDLTCLKTELNHSRKTLAKLPDIIQSYRDESKAARLEVEEIRSYEQQSRALIYSNVMNQVRQIVDSRLDSARSQYRDCANRSRSPKLRPKTDKARLLHKDEQIAILVAGIIETQDAIRLFSKLFSKNMADMEVDSRDAYEKKKRMIDINPDEVFNFNEHE